jgi:hypothetical protein
MKNFIAWFKKEMTMTGVERIVVCSMAIISALIAISTVVIAEAAANIFLPVLAISCIVLFFAIMGLVEILFYPAKFFKS